MHQLDRTQAAVPQCLAMFAYPGQTWNDVMPEDRQEIRTSLIQMQSELCAYCECALYGDGHIEHFRRKKSKDYPQLAFDWNNLFLSCQSADHCGHYKDRPNAPAYNPNDIIKPDVDDPDRFFHFHSSGEIRVREGLSGPDKRRAAETIRVFHLDEPTLSWNRHRAIQQYWRNHPDIINFLMTCDAATRYEFIQEEIESTRADPHWTVIKHSFEKYR